RGKGLFVEIAQKAWKWTLQNRLPVDVHEIVFPPLETYQLPRQVPIGDCRAHAELGGGVKMRISSPMPNPVEEPGDGTKGGALPGFVRTVDDVKPTWCSPSKVENLVGERTEGPQVEFVEPHTSSSAE